MSQDPAPPLDSQLCFSLYAASIAVNRTYKPMLDGLGLTYPQYLVLSTLWEEDGLPVSAIADRLSLESSTITPLVKRLESGRLPDAPAQPEGRAAGARQPDRQGTLDEGKDRLPDPDPAGAFGTDGGSDRQAQPAS
jgi:hypothetical protein